ncbi:hypothetical protein [Empedobacter sedimenti]|uniref:hypothetical protein n=1 Tax=Empedobacter sedimenti TaxID=3042610 RepID=UPI0024A79A88|nr:hypothetical protein [Empedobacter sedimenti]
MKVNYDYITYEDVMRARQFMYEQALEQNATNSILSTARELFGNSNFEMCIKICEGLLDAKDPKQLYDAKKLIALSYYSLQDYENADKAFFELAQNSDNSDDWFNVVITSAMNKNLERSQESFGIALEKYTKFGHQRNMPSVQLMLHYMITLETIEEYALAMEQFTMLAQVYAKLKKTDEKFLNSRGLEQIENFLETAKPVLKKAKKKELNDIKKELLDSLDANGVEKVEAFFAEF